MEKDITYTINGWDSENVESIHQELKEYAIDLGWEENVTTEEGETVPNPKGYEEVIFVDKPMEGFWAWLKEHKREEGYQSVNETVETEVQDLASQVAIGVE